MPTGMKYNYRLVDRNDKKVCIQYAGGMWTLRTKTLVKGEWIDNEERLGEEDIRDMTYQIMRLGGAAMPTTGGNPQISV